MKQEKCSFNKVILIIKINKHLRWNFVCLSRPHTSLAVIPLFSFPSLYSNGNPSPPGRTCNRRRLHIRFLQPCEFSNFFFFFHPSVESITKQVDLKSRQNRPILGGNVFVIQNFPEQGVLIFDSEVSDGGYRLGKLIGRASGDDDNYEQDIKDEEECLFASVYLRKLQFRKHASTARWNDRMGITEVLENKGSLWTTTGIVGCGKIYCSIEETL
ncbi:hypothetical protein IC582_008953 [Cucumis melo]